MKKIIIAIGVVAAVIAVFAVIFVRRGEFYYAGTIEATEVDLSARIAGTIDTIAAEEGDSVTAGQELIKLSIKDIEVAAEQAEREYQRALRLLKAGSMSREEYDRIAFKRDDLAVRQEWGRISSPIDGVVLNRYHEPGELVMPGTKLLTLADLRSVWAYIYMEQPMLAQIALGRKLSGFIAESDIRALTGTVVHIRDEAEFTPKNVQTRSERTRLVYGIKLRFDNPEKILKPGMTVEIRSPR